MRIRRIFSAALFLGLICSQIQASEKEVESKISDVVVFLNGAQITRIAETQIPAGETQIVFKGLTSQMTSNSLQVSAKPEIDILSVNHSQDYMVSPKVNEQIRSLRKQRDQLQDSIALAKNRQKVLTQEQEMLLNNQSVGGRENGLNVEQLRNAIDFFRKRMTEIEQNLFELNKQITPMEERFKKLNKQLEELNAQKDRPTSSVIVKTSSERAINASFQISYTVHSAYWQPFYDLRVKNIEEPLNLNYKAKISQNTGIDWDDVNLSLSTGDPSVNQEKPDLDPWIIRPIRPLTREITDTDKSKRMVAGATLQMAGEEAPKAPSRISPEKQQTTTIFRINQPFSIQSGGKEHDVAIMEHEIDAEYQYATVPKRSPHAYLMAEITDWNDMELLPGEAAIYFNQTFKGNTFIDPYIAEDTLSLSIGRDPGIVVDREVQKDYSSNTFFGNNQKKTKAWKISVRNNKNTAVDIVVEDQIPVSGDSEIKVELEESSGARVNRKTGLLKWPLSLEPGETRDLNFVYSVQYPKETRIILE